MAHPFQMKKTMARVNERDFPFVVQIAVPDGGFGCALDAINAWHYYSKNKQRQGRRHYAGEQEFWRWCFGGLEIAKSFRHRFGGEIMPVTVRRVAEQPRPSRPHLTVAAGAPTAPAAEDGA